jgi:pyridoxamine 5'-phosphate oxidase family protein
MTDRLDGGDAKGGSMSFTQDEIDYLRSQPLARLATVGPDGQPDVVPVMFEFDGSVFYIGGRAPANTRKFRNVRKGHSQVALVIDDLHTREPWAPRFVRVYGTGELVERDGQFGFGPYMRITPTVSWSWNLDPLPYGPDHNTSVGMRRTVHDAPS